MEKPSLEKYGLTKKELERYLNQKKLFDIEYKKHLANNEKISVVITWIVSTVIEYFLILLVDYTIFTKYPWVFFVIPIGAFFCPTLLILAIKDGPYKFLDREKEIKARYYSIELERKFINYTTALKEYNHYLEQKERNYWIQMSGLEFEKEVAFLYQGKGYNVKITSATGDGGVDIILTQGNERIAVQCKHHAKPVGPNDVRALQGVVAAQNYSKGIFVSLNGYTSTVRQEVRYGNVYIELLELKDILRMVQEEHNPSAEQENKTQNLSHTITEREKIIKLYERLSNEDLSRLVGKRVEHKCYGEGRISDIIDRNYIEIYFSEISEYKKFVFPDAFADKYLVPINFKIIKKGE